MLEFVEILVFIFSGAEGTGIAASGFGIDLIANFDPGIFSVIIFLF